VSIDFAYAQARVQACLGARLPEAGWRMLESIRGLAPFLAAIRNTALAPKVRHFSAAVTPHAIERTLRDDWRDQVGAVARWVPEPWSPAVEWAAWLPYLEAIAGLMRDEPVLAWMRDDGVLRAIAIDDRSARLRAIDDSPFGVLADSGAPGTVHTRWFARWAALAPDTSADEEAGLQALTATVRDYLDTARGQSASPGAPRNARARVTGRAIRLVHSRVEEPVVVFCHLLLVALELQRLRGSLLRRALFDGQPGEQAA